MKYVLVLELDPKEDDSVGFPSLSDVRIYLRGVLPDVTDRDASIGWRVTSVGSLRSALGDWII